MVEKNMQTAFSKIITASPKMKALFQDVSSVSKTLKPVLVTGETGVGKELFVEAIHDLSGLHGRFVTVNAAGLDDNMFSDTIFGHVKGAYTGADQDRLGLVERANNGTLVLDEIGDLSLASQIKLLRLIQEGEYFPLGTDTPKKTNVRILAVTNRDLWELQRIGKFRSDLNFRLRTHHIHIPPLRERLEDLPYLVDHFLARAAYALKKEKPKVPKELIPLLETFPFLGNIRELQDIIFDAVSRQKSDYLPLDVFRSYATKAQNDRSFLEGLSSFESTSVIFPANLPTLKNMASILVQEAMKRAGGNQTIAAGLLGITQQALSKRLKNMPEFQKVKQNS